MICLEINELLASFNNHLLDRGYSFYVYSIDSYCVYIQASFDLGYYVNVHIECREQIFTTFKKEEKWPDAWHQKQIFLMSQKELEETLLQNNIEQQDNSSLLGLKFNTNDGNYPHMGYVICKKLYINWENPKHGIFESK